MWRSPSVAWHVDISEALRAAAEEKIGRLRRFMDGMDRAVVHFPEERNPRIVDKEVCEVTMEGHGHQVRGKVAAADQFAAIDLAVDKLEHQLHKLKTKLLAATRAPCHDLPPAESAPVSDWAIRTGKSRWATLVQSEPGAPGKGAMAEPAPPRLLVLTADAIRVMIWTITRCSGAAW